MEKDYIFSLDIGTRTVVGILLKAEGDKLVLQEAEVVEHKNRSMLDGQIHNVVDVAEQIKKIKIRLEKKCGFELNEVGIAAAGRALRTVKEHYEIEFNKKKEISDKDVKVLEFGAVQQAQEKLFATKEQNDNSRYHFVGYSVLQSMVDGIKVGNLTGQKGAKIEVDIIATFLPEIVVDSLLSAISQAGLSVKHLTLEPIAASNIVVPKQMHNFNLALVDIGAGTSDIAITKGGAVIGFAMVPVAGDEITEAICEQHMIDYHSGERVKKKLLEEDVIAVKDILGQQIEISSSKVIEKIDDKVSQLARLISKEILALNNDSPQAIICIGGGSLTPLLKEKLAEEFDLPKNRVGIKNIADIDEVEGVIEGLSGTQAITPFGIGISYQNDTTQTNFIDVDVNNETVNIFTLTEPKISDALLVADIDIKEIKGRPGLAISVEVNGNLKMVKGTMGEKGSILLNGEKAQIDSRIENGDQIEVELGKKGQTGKGIVADVVPDLPSRELVINGNQIEVEPIYYLNGEQVDASAELEDRAKISYKIPQTIEDIMEGILDIDVSKVKKKRIEYEFNGEIRNLEYSNYTILLNEKEAELGTEINDKDKLIIKEESTSRLRVKDILAREKTDNNLKIKFNDEVINVPPKKYILRKNGKKADREDLLYNGDVIEYKPALIRLNQVLDYIDYEIPTTVKGKLVVEKNNEKAKLIEPIADGDQIRIYVKRND